ncbi:uncharacterized protein LOC106162883 [Lingula anatina]|uniref:Uncharacterized protein LOC106162883 n=1 Tax=Lingula anatina TaxID=7574 RepID=A0A1S3IE87_LINAN|nr:uncharacterized protein LOC106162883 [Lingula anatina]|eukprot:XP_013395769.1 uncharacterized protein LOC106162883 [Lingula anatina]
MKVIDIGTVKPVVDSCKMDLKVMKDGSVHLDQPTFSKQLEEHLTGATFKVNHVVAHSKYKTEVTKRDSIQAMLDNSEKRFPDQELMSSFCVLGMKPISLLSQDELQCWGDEAMEMLTSHFGEKMHTMNSKESVSNPY